MKKIFLLFFLFSALLIKAQDIDVLHYRFSLDLNDNNDTIKGFTGIRFVMKNDSKVASLDLEGVNGQGRGMRVSKVITGQHETMPLSFSHSTGNLVIRLPMATRGDTCMVYIAYAGVPADGLIISRNKFGERTFFGDNWPNRAHHWIPCVDRPDDKASFEFIVSAPSHYRVISNGVKLQEKEAGGNITRTHWREDTPLPTKVMVIGAARFAVKTYEDSPPSIPVSAWMYPQDSTNGFYDFALATDILKYVSGYVAPFPYKKLANVQSTTIFGGMENASCIFYAENLVKGDRSIEETIAHEIAHQWFGDMVSEKSFAHLWLSEGFATYLTTLYVEKKYGKEVMATRLKNDRDEVIDFAGFTTRPVVDSTKDLMSLLNANSYQKGGWILHLLRNEVGDLVFQKIVQTFYDQYNGGNADSRDFEAVAEKVSGKELTWFFDQWLYRPGIPVLQVSTKVQNNEFTLFVKQLGKPYQLTLAADLVLASGEVVRKYFDLKNVNHVFKIPVKSNSVTFTLDPDVTLLYQLKK